MANLEESDTDKTEREAKFDTDKFDRDNPVVIKMGMEFTRQTTQFEPLDFSIHLEVPVKPGEKVSEAIDKVYTMIENKLVEKQKRIDKAFDVV